jgi:membrane associated rhomboid family serine protease
MHFPAPPPALRKLLIALCVAYFLSMLALRGGFTGFYSHLELQPAAVFSGEVWRLLSYGLLHGSVGHLIGNLLLFYFFGMEIERQFGARMLWKLTALCTLGGGIVAAVASTVGLASQAPVIGASGGALGVLVAWCLVNARRSINLFGILPLTGKQLLYLSVGFELLMAVSPSNNSSAAHLGGMASAWLVITGGIAPRHWLKKLRLARLRRGMRKQNQPKLSVLRGGKKQPSKDDWLN